MTIRSLPPYPSGDLRQWAMQLVEFLQDRATSRDEVFPAPVLLEHQTDVEAARTGTDGIMMFDPIRGTVLISVSGEWLSLYPAGGAFGSGMHWDGTWLSQVYDAGSVVLDQPYLMIANKETSDRPAPQPVGDPSYDLPDTPLWDADGQFSGSVWTGAEYTITTAVEIISYDVWVPEVSPNTAYTIRVYEYPVGEPEKIVYFPVALPPLNTNDWTTVTTSPTIKPAGLVVGVVIDALNSGSSTAPGGTPADWIRAASSNSATPPAGGWNTSINGGVLRINELTADSGLIDLSGVIAGSTFQIVDTTDPAKSVTYSAQTGETYDPVGQSYSWGVVQDALGPSGAPLTGSRCVITITVPVPSPTKYKVDLDGNAVRTLPTGVTSRGVKREGGAVIPVDDQAFGVRANFQPISLSPDWDIMAVSGGSASSGGGESGIPEAPEDGTLYGRKNADWEPVPDANPIELQEYHDPTGVASWRIVGTTLECWGTYSSGATGPTITFPKTFAAAPNVVTSGADNDSRMVTSFNITTTSFVGKSWGVSGNGNGSPFRWRAIGEWDGVS